jgi:hypothetical protein
MSDGARRAAKGGLQWNLVFSFPARRGYCSDGVRVFQWLWLTRTNLSGPKLNCEMP